MIESSGGASFLLEPAQAVGVGGETCRQDLDSDVAAKASVAGTVDLSHAAGADCGGNFIRTELSTRIQHWREIIS